MDCVMAAVGFTFYGQLRQIPTGGFRVKMGCKNWGRITAQQLANAADDLRAYKVKEYVEDGRIMVGHVLTIRRAYPGSYCTNVRIQFTKQPKGWSNWGGVTTGASQEQMTRVARNIDQFLARCGYDVA